MKNIVQFSLPHDEAAYLISALVMLECPLPEMIRSAVEQAKSRRDALGLERRTALLLKIEAICAAMELSNEDGPA